MASIVNAFSDYYHNAYENVEQKSSKSQIIIWDYCNIVQNEYSKITGTKLVLFQIHTDNSICRKHINIIN